VSKCGGVGRRTQRGSENIEAAGLLQHHEVAPKRWIPTGDADDQTDRSTLGIEIRKNGSAAGNSISRTQKKLSPRGLSL
jgi:hypothetical protein